MQVGVGPTLGQGLAAERRRGVSLGDAISPLHLFRHSFWGTRPQLFADGDRLATPGFEHIGVARVHRSPSTVLAFPPG